MGPNSFPWIHDSDGGYPPVENLEEAIDRLINLHIAVIELRDRLDFPDYPDYPVEGPEEFIDLGDAMRR